MSESREMPGPGFGILLSTARGILFSIKYSRARDGFLAIPQSQPRRVLLEAALFTKAYE